MVVHFSQEQLLEVALTEPEAHGEAGQDDEGNGHDPGDAVVFVVAVAMPMGVVIVAVGVFNVDHVAGDLAVGLRVLGEEHDKDHPEGVISRQEGPQQAQDQPELVVQVGQSRPGSLPC